MKNLFLIGAICIASLLNAQSSGVYVADIHLLNKADRWCWAIGQDSDKNMLFGVERGVVVYDGTNQTLIKTPFTPYALLYDKNNNKVWVSGSENFGVLEHSYYAKYNYNQLNKRHDNEFKKIHLLNDTVYFISDSLIVRYNAKTLDKIDEYPTKGLIIDEVIEYRGKLYFVIEYFLHIIDNNKLVELTNTDFPVDEFTYGVTINSNTIILGTSDNTTYSFNGKSFYSFTLKSPFFENNMVTNGYYYTDSTLIASSLAGGIAIIDYKKKKVIKQVSYFNGLPDDEIRTVFVDADKGIWLSHEFGISRVDFNLGIENYSYYPGLKGNPIAINYFNQNLYVATSNGLFVLDEVKDYNEFKVKVRVPVNVAVKVPTENNKEADSNKKKGFFSFKSKKADGNNNNKKKNKTQTKRKIVHKTRTIKKRSLKSISHYFKQVEGMSGKFTQLVPYNNFLLVAGNNGLYAVNGKESENILKNRYIVDIYVSDCCTEAYCCTNNGIYKIFRQNNKWKINHFAQTTNALINSIAYDKNKKWVVSYENMLFRGKFNNKKIDILQEIELPEKPGQTFIVKNINDSIMVFTSNKLYHFTDDGKLNVIKEFADDNYIIHNQNIFTWLYNNAQWSLCCKTEFNKNAQFLNRLSLFKDIRYIDLDYDNNLWIIDDQNHLFKINKQTQSNQINFKITLMDLQSNLQSIIIDNNISLKSRQNNITTKFSAPFYILQNGVTYSYLIQGLNPSWSEWTPMSEINLGYIPPGDYTLFIKAKNTLGQIAEGKSIQISVPKPFTQTPLFYILLVIVFTLIAFVIFKIRLQKLKKDKQILEQKVKERTATIEDQKSKLEKQHDEITQSIRYAKRIQTAMLPHNEIIDAMLPHHFILFNPRDIVSGDFYFFKPLGDKIVFVAADCTGHGVPGGFMSMLGISFLSEITSQLPAPTAGEIIDHLREKIKLTLGQTDIESTQKDGMDLAICVIDTNKKQVQYAGAFNSLFLIRNGELEIIKADRQPVSVYFKEASFTNHIIDVQPNDKFYMFSDGFADQIGGPRNRKFMTKNFKTLLLENYKLPMNEQKEILQKSLNDWRGDSMQVDDILVVGFQL